MTAPFRTVHFGAGAFARFKQAVPADPTLVKPPRAQHATLERRISQREREQADARRATQLSHRHAERYGPTELLDLADDQCPFIRDDGLRCGQRKTGSWCASHAIELTRRPP